MPEIARFNGIVIKMYYGDKDHNPPHAHASFGSHAASVDLNSGEILAGKLPTPVRKQVKEWVMNNKDELMEIWNSQEFHRIEEKESK